SPTVYISRDSGALSLGAETVATAITAEAGKRGQNVRVVRTGSRGMYWLEPLVEVETSEGRGAYGPGSPSNVPGPFEACFFEGGNHPLGHGLTESIPYLKNQERLTFFRVGLIDPLSLEEYLASDGYEGLKNALTLSGEQIVKDLIESGLRGRGGAGFPTGIKW